MEGLYSKVITLDLGELLFVIVFFLCFVDGSVFNVTSFVASAGLGY